jgi:hypothetical protein
MVSFIHYFTTQMEDRIVLIKFSSRIPHEYVQSVKCKGKPKT